MLIHTGTNGINNESKYFILKVLGEDWKMLSSLFPPCYLLGQAIIAEPVWPLRSKCSLSNVLELHSHTDGL